MKLFNYNSKHKVVVGVLVILWAAYSFSGGREANVYSEQGQVLQTGDFRDGKNHGKWIWYYPNGKKKMEGRFNMGSREGEWFTYNNKEQVLTKSNYKNDKLEGIVTVFDETQNIVSQTLYLNDEIVKKELESK